MNRRRFTQQLAAFAGAMAIGRAARAGDAALAPTLRVDGERINRHLLELSQFG